MNRLERAQYVNSWMQTIAICIAGLWILGYNLIYKDLYKPSKNPTHVTPKLSLKIGEPINGFIPVSASMELENESKRDVYILPGIFLAVGSKLKPIDSDANRIEFLKYITEIANEDDDLFESRYLFSEQAQVVAGGGVFSGFVLSPNENASKTYVFHVPENKFDVIEVTLQFWAHKGKKELWSKIDFPNDDEFKNEPCEIINMEPWECKPIPTGDEGAERRKVLDLWDFESRAQAPLPKTVKINNKSKANKANSADAKSRAAD